MSNRELTLITNTLLPDAASQTLVRCGILLSGGGAGVTPTVAAVVAPGAPLPMGSSAPGAPLPMGSSAPGASLPEGSADVRTIDAGGRLALPSFVDIHCHLREPGFEYKEDIASGTAAAAAGGYAAVLAMPNTNPVCDNIETLEYIKRAALERGACDVLLSAAITVGQKGEELCDFDALSAHGAVAFTDDGRPVSDAAVMLLAMRRCAERGYLIISHAEELSLAAGGAVNENAARRMGVPGISPLAEDVMTARDIILAEETGCRLHIAHVSTARSIRLIREAKARGVNVTSETCPHYFAFTEREAERRGALARMNPPLRLQADVDAVIEALSDGTIDCISTDHAPHSAKEKALPVEDAPSGVTGLETAFAAAVTYLVKPGHISIFKLAELMSYNPSRILGRPCGILPGADAFITLADLDCEREVTESGFVGKSHNTPFIGRTLTGSAERVSPPVKPHKE